METQIKEFKEVLPKQVHVKPSRKHAWLPENHDGSFRFSRTYEELTLQRERNTGILNTGLTETTQKQMESKLGLQPGTLSRHNMDYWQNFKLKIPKEGVTLRPNDNPTDELAYRVLLVHQEVANSVATKVDWPYSRYVMESEEEVTETANREFNLKFEAYKKIGEMTEAQKINFLTVYGKKPGKDSSIDFINAQIGKIADSEPRVFLDTLNNPSYKTTLLIKQCVAAGVLKESGGKYFRPGGEVIGYSIDQTIDFLSNPDNQEVLASIKGQLQAVSK